MRKRSASERSRAIAWSGSPASALSSVRAAVGSDADISGPFLASARSWRRAQDRACINQVIVPLLSPAHCVFAVPRARPCDHAGSARTRAPALMFARPARAAVAPLPSDGQPTSSSCPSTWPRASNSSGPTYLSRMVRCDHRARGALATCVRSLRLMRTGHGGGGRSPAGCERGSSHSGQPRDRQPNRCGVRLSPLCALLPARPGAVVHC
jgi:hypothetical protein